MTFEFYCFYITQPWNHVRPRNWRKQNILQSGSIHCSPLRVMYIYIPSHTITVSFVHTFYTCHNHTMLDPDSLQIVHSVLSNDLVTLKLDATHSHRCASEKLSGYHRHTSFPRSHFHSPSSNSSAKTIIISLISAFSHADSYDGC